MDHQIILTTLKRVLKEKKILYKTLAKEIGMSESGLKKLLAGNDISLNRLSKISNAIGISLIDLMNLANEEEVKAVSLSEKQEEALLEDMAMFRVLWRMSVEERSEEETLRLEAITKRKLQSYLLKLENLDLIRVSKVGKVQSIHKGLYRWKGSGKLIEKLNRDWSKKLLTKALKNEEGYHQLSYLQVSLETKERFLFKLQDLVDEFARASRQDRLRYSKQDLDHSGLLICFDRSGMLD